MADPTPDTEQGSRRGPIIADGRILGGVRVSTVTLTLLFLITLLGYLAVRPDPPDVHTVTGIPSPETSQDQTQAPAKSSPTTPATPTSKTPTTTTEPPSTTPTEEPAPTQTSPPTVPGIPGLPLPQIPGLNAPTPTPTSETSATPTP